MPLRADDFLDQEGNIASAASDVENVHAFGDSRFQHELPGNRVNEICLPPQAFQLPVRVPKNVIRLNVSGHDVPRAREINFLCGHLGAGSNRMQNE